MSDLIQALKENEKPFGLMTEEMQAKAKEIGRDQEFEYYNYDDTWHLCVIQDSFDNNCTYHLRPDHTEKPKVVECEVYEKLGWLMCDYEGEKEIDVIMSLQCFVGFKYENEFFHVSPRLYANKVTKKCVVSFLDSEIDDYEVLTPTHVLFKAIN